MQCLSLTLLTTAVFKRARARATHTPGLIQQSLLVRPRDFPEPARRPSAPDPASSAGSISKITMVDARRCRARCHNGCTWLAGWSGWLVHNSTVPGPGLRVRLHHDLALY